MLIEDMPVYSATKEMDSYLKEMNSGILDKKGLELIRTLKLNDGILEENMYKVQSFESLESIYKRLGDDLFSPQHSESLKILFKTMFNY